MLKSEFAFKRIIVFWLDINAQHTSFKSVLSSYTNHGEQEQRENKTIMISQGLMIHSTLFYQGFVIYYTRVFIQFPYLTRFCTVSRLFYYKQQVYIALMFTNIFCQFVVLCWFTHQLIFPNHSLQFVHLQVSSLFSREVALLSPIHQTSFTRSYMFFLTGELSLSLAPPYHRAKILLLFSGMPTIIQVHHIHNPGLSGTLGFPYCIIAIRPASLILWAEWIVGMRYNNNSYTVPCVQAPTHLQITEIGPYKCSIVNQQKQSLARFKHHLIDKQARNYVKLS